MLKHFELTDLTTVTPDGVTLYRIRALRDLPDLGVTAGDLGGYVESVDNLSGDAWVSGDAQVTGHALVCGGAMVSGRARVSGHAIVCGDAWVYGDEQVTGHALVTGPVPRRA